jgi:uncharacterized protein (DUF433 family)
MDREIAQGITVNPERQSGQPCITGTRIPAWCVSDLARQGYSVDRIISEYPDLNALQIADALAYQLRPARERRIRLAALDM